MTTDFNWKDDSRKLIDEVIGPSTVEAAKLYATQLDKLIQANANATTQINGFRNQMSDATQQVQKQMVADENVERQRWMELEREEAERRGRFQNDPRMQVAAMLAMGGQPGALQSLLVSSVQQDMQKAEKAAAAKKDAQSKMDALENSINTDLMYLAGTNQDQIDKALNVSVPLFEAKLQELTDAGATSRMGGLAVWKKIFTDFRQKGQKKKDNANRKKNRNSKLGFE